jgi:hypothetical protein
VDTVGESGGAGLGLTVSGAASERYTGGATRGKAGAKAVTKGTFAGSATSVGQYVPGCDLDFRSSAC